jgi:PAT family beta-lactamase induction signal transducer AmpG
VGYDVFTLVCTVGFENFTGGLGTAAFVAYLSALSDRAHSATQYALLTALAGTVRMLLSMGSGYAAEWLGWTLYFAVTAVAALPGLLVLRYIQRRGLTGLVRGH